MTKRLNSKHKVDRRLKVNLWGRPKSPFIFRKTIEKLIIIACKTTPKIPRLIKPSNTTPTFAFISGRPKYSPPISLVIEIGFELKKLNMPC